MSGWTTTLHVGLTLWFEGELCTVTEIDGRRIGLRQRSADGRVRWRQVDLSVLLTHPGTRFLTDEGEPGPAAAAVLGSLTPDEEDAVTVRFRHIQEVLTGFQLGCAELALEGEPRPDYAPGTALMHRYRAKATELGVGVTTLRRWIGKVEGSGPAGLLDKRAGSSVLDRIDSRWVDMARSVLAAKVPKSRPVRSLVLIEIEERLAEKFKEEAPVPIPARTRAYAALAELSRGTNAFEGSTKGKRSIANRPKGTYGRLRATRPGEYAVLDTNRLDVFAMEPVTCRWVQCELTVSMDLYSRCITGLRLTPVSTKSVDVAGVLFETVRPRDLPGEAAGPLPYCGVPSTVVVDADSLVDQHGMPLLPTAAAETIIYDHGKVFLSNHIRSVCARLEISLQPARPYTPTDKPVERWFKTLNQGLLAALPGYKGADVHSRGENVEQEAFFFLDELEMIIREWIDRIYHRRPHRGLTVPEVPGLKMSPLEMFEHGVHRAGPLRIPTRPNLALEFLDQVRTTIQHYGVEIGGLRYNGDALDEFRGQRSDWQGVDAGKWPIAVDPGDIRQVYFQHPRDHDWHPLAWEHAPALGGPVSREAVAYARRLATRTHRFPDTKRALVDLLDRWGAGLAADRVERRMAVRISQERLLLVGPDEIAQPQDGPAQIADLPSLKKLAALQDPLPAGSDAVAELALGGDDDEDDECEAVFPGELEPGARDEDDFYADVWESR
ncbi:transposase InsO family protein [Streptacidiphilus sp. MAP12-33]|uniref:Mu transposase C-terminal domain-containing protein n=1 Tax=Streptacidiphilus sp. MAP12-33 TaxID=3156266 RepID=UPI0035170C12